MPRKVKSAKQMVFNPLFKMRVVTNRKGKGAYKRMQYNINHAQEEDELDDWKVGISENKEEVQ